MLIMRRTMNFKERLEWAMGQKGLKTPSLAKLSGVHRATIQGWVDGSVPSIEHIPAVSRELGVSPCWLAFGLGERDSLLLPMDSKLMKRALDTLEEGLARQSRTKSPTAEQRSNLVAVFYGILIQGGSLDPSIVDQMIALLPHD